MPPRIIAKVVEVNGDGTCTVQTDSGYQFGAIGTGTVNDYVYVQDGLILGVASTLVHGVIDV